MECIRHRFALARTRFAHLARAACVLGAAIVVAACASGPARTPLLSMPTLAPYPNPASASAGPTVPVTDVPSSDQIPDSPMTTSALAAGKPQRSGGTPVGAVVFGNDVTVHGKNVSLAGERTTFAAGHPIAWRVMLRAATGGESVRVTLTATDDTETLVDQFVAQAGWNVYFGKSLLTVAPGTYVLHYLVDGHEQGSGTFKIKAADAVVPSPT